MGGMIRDKSDINKYYLVFTQHNTDGSHWQEKLFKWIFDRLKPGFSHVSVIIERPNRPDYPFMVVESCSNNLFCEEISRPDLLFLLANSGATILQVPRKEGKIGFRGFISCVSVAKHFLGINNRALTPYQLYKSFSKEKKNGWKKTKATTVATAGLFDN